MIRFKEGVSLVGICPQIAVAIAAAECVYRDYADGADTVITSGSEPSSWHSRTSLHYAGAAVDLRTKHLASDVEKRIVAKMLRDSLRPAGFDVILESLGGDQEHIHIEYQPKRPP